MHIPCFQSLKTPYHAQVKAEHHASIPQAPRPPLALQGLKLLPMPSLLAPPFLLPTCPTLVAWNVLAGLNVSTFCSASLATSLSSGGEEGGSTGGGLERNVYGFDVECKVPSFLLLADVGLVVRGVVRSLKFESCGTLVGTVEVCCCRCPGRVEERFEISLRGLETWRGIEAGGLGGA
jgi:hypothetical protein